VSGIGGHVRNADLTLSMTILEGKAFNPPEWVRKVMEDYAKTEAAWRAKLEGMGAIFNGPYMIRDVGNWTGRGA
jgi:hypothetical protein